ncbi:hypothetical protein [Nonomuraea soli]|uniref:Chitin-binding type-2 domain-containing protein n=1 Tax=Nonomuraea soli TaxID=1032476 RepID=A0A7W0CKD7_9ACTN|nr:hypothetical protein [Nonomuraea soli]MBA2892696.1 hypothetical protein [Nonomuraea soli]
MKRTILLAGAMIGLSLTCPAPVAADPVGPCYVLTFSVDERQGARSICPPGTWRHWHQVHVHCTFIASVPTHGPMVGGTSVSEVICPDNQMRTRAWNTQGPDE